MNPNLSRGGRKGRRNSVSKGPGVGANVAHLGTGKSASVPDQQQARGGQSRKS